MDTVDSNVKKVTLPLLLVTVIQMMIVVVANIVILIVKLVSEIPNTNVSDVLKDTLPNLILILPVEELVQMDSMLMKPVDLVFLVTSLVPLVQELVIMEIVQLVLTIMPIT
jgi:hypothetical protein